MTNVSSNLAEQVYQITHIQELLGSAKTRGKELELALQDPATQNPLETVRKMFYYIEESLYTKKYPTDFLVTLSDETEDDRSKKIREIMYYDQEQTKIDQIDPLEQFCRDKLDGMYSKRIKIEESKYQKRKSLNSEGQKEEEIEWVDFKKIIRTFRNFVIAERKRFQDPIGGRQLWEQGKKYIEVVASKDENQMPKHQEKKDFLMVVQKLLVYKREQKKQLVQKNDYTREYDKIMRLRKVYRERKGKNLQDICQRQGSKGSIKRTNLGESGLATSIWNDRILQFKEAREEEYPDEPIQENSKVISTIKNALDGKIRSRAAYNISSEEKDERHKYEQEIAVYEELLGRMESGDSRYRMNSVDQNIIKDFVQKDMVDYGPKCFATNEQSEEATV